jgi:hypothetical protein
MPEPEDAVDEPFFDHLAVLIENPDARSEELHRLLRDDERIRVPAKVLNTARGQEEAV